MFHNISYFGHFHASELRTGEVDMEHSGCFGPVEADDHKSIAT